jgi:actin-like ATPase involved in cell morphogenesis
MTKLVGIDFGTSTTLIAVRDNQDATPQILPIGHGANPWMPSVVAQTSPISVGESATEAEGLLQIRSIKSGLTRGQDWLDEQYLSIDHEHVKQYVIEILTEAKRRAEQVYPDLFNDAKFFFGCPALWSFGNRRILADVANDLGMDVDVLDVLDEPVAAGVHWVKTSWAKDKEGVSGRTLVFDAGGGTLDVALIETSDNASPEVSVLAANSLSKSGDDVDYSIVEYLRRRDSRLGSDGTSSNRLMNAARELKEILSDETEASVQVDESIGKILSLTRQELEEVIELQVQESLRIVDRVLVESDIRISPNVAVAESRKRLPEIAKTVKNVLLVGGLSQIPLFRQRLQEMFPLATVYSVKNPQQAVAEGLTYADTVIHLNMPRPPLSFVIRPGLESAEDVIYEAYSEIVDSQGAQQGFAFLGLEREFEDYPDGTYEILCVLPNRQKTEIPLIVSKLGSSIGVKSLTVTHRLRNKNDQMFFKLYATGEFLVRGANENETYRTKTWGRLAYGKDLSDIRLEIETKAGKGWSDDRNDSAASSRK